MYGDGTRKHTATAHPHPFPPTCLFVDYTSCSAYLGKRLSSASQAKKGSPTVLWTPLVPSFYSVSICSLDLVVLLGRGGAAEES